MTRASEKAITTEHNAIVDVVKEDECYTNGIPYVDYIENFYVGDYTLHIFENLRFYKRKNGKVVAIYRNPKTGKGMASPAKKYLSDIEEKITKIFIPMKRSDIEVMQHLKTHIRIKILRNQRETVARLRREKERANS